jgi:phage-related protein
VRSIEIHAKARDVIRGFSKEVRVELGSALLKVQMGMALGLPISRPMPSVYPGAHELRFRDASGIQRVFYYLKSPRAILVFHAFAKQSRKTPPSEIALGRRRLKEMLSHEKS